MTKTNCDCDLSCTTKGIIAGIIIGIITAILRYNAIITLTPAFLWVLLGIAVVYLGIALLTSGINLSKNNCCTNLSTFLTAIAGTTLTSIVLLGITFAATSIIGAVISGVALFFFTLLIISAICLIKCRYSCNS